MSTKKSISRIFSILFILAFMLVSAPLQAAHAAGVRYVKPGSAGDIVVPPEEEVHDDPEDADIVAQIKELIETRVRPAVANDGGDIIYRGFNKGTVFLKMQGACAGCPSSTATLKHGIESLLKHYVPEVTEVRAA